METDGNFSKPKLLILDGHSLAHRAFYALPLLTNSLGEYTNAALGFATMLFKLLEDERPTHVVVAFDLPAPTFRHLKAETYKAHRKPMPDEMRPQIATIKGLVDAFGIAALELEGFEADDIIGTVAKRAGAEGADVIIVTGDRDALQLVDERISVMLTRKGISEVDRFNAQAVVDKYGVTPQQVPDMKGLMGDASDNIPGVPGVGEKTAVKLVQEFGSVENLLDNLDSVQAKKLKATLEANVEGARLSKELATIDTEVPIEAALGSLGFASPSVDKLRAALERLEFRNLLKRIDDGKVAFLPPSPAPGNPPSAPDGSPAPHVPAVVLPETPYTLVRASEAAGLLPSLLVPGAYVVEARLDGTPMRGSLSLVAVRPTGDSSTGRPIAVFMSDDGTGQDLIGALAPFLTSPECHKVLHDSKGLSTHLRHRGVVLEGLRGDTMVGAYLLNSTARSYALDDIAFIHLGTRAKEWESGKGSGLPFPQEIHEHRERDARLAASRVGVVEALEPVLVAKLEEAGMGGLYRDVEIPLVGVLSEMEANGIRVDVARLGELSRALGARLEELDSQICELVGEKFNINSPKQLADILFVKLGLPPKKKTATGFSTDVEVLEELAEEHELPGLILEYRQVAKLKSTYADSLATLADPQTGRVHTTFNQAVAATGRLSSTDPNMQNIPIRTEEGRKIREVFIADGEDWVFVAGDYSQIELRVLAHFSGDPTLTESFNNGEDIHTRTASEVFGVPHGSVTRQMRDAAKAVNFGIVYGQTSFGLGRGLGISRKQAQEYIDNYLGRYPGVRDYMARIAADARRDGFVTTLLGRRRYIPDISSRKYATRQFAERTAMNTPIQGSAADIIKAAMVEVSRALRQAGLACRLVLQVHDELVIEAPMHEKDIAKQILRANMENVTKIACPLKVDVKVGSKWSDVVSEG